MPKYGAEAPERRRVAAAEPSGRQAAAVRPVAGPRRRAAVRVSALRQPAAVRLVLPREPARQRVRPFLVGLGDGAAQERAADECKSDGRSEYATPGHG